MKTINVYGGYVSFVDDEMYELLIKHSWHLTRDGYAAAGISRNGKKMNLLMHRVILGITDPSIQTDHKDHNKLNNLRENIRPCSHSQNQQNKIPKGRSKYLGVLYQKRINNIREYEVIIARIRVDGKLIKIGQFKTEEDAALAYDNAATKYFGEFANLNFK